MSQKKNEYGLFGLMNSNRDFQDPAHWGKNEFNSSFPAALACYMASVGKPPILISVGEKGNIDHSKISVEQLFGVDPSSPSIYFAFEEPFEPYAKYVRGGLPRVDLVTRVLNEDGSHCDVAALEVKLTALPDEATSKNTEDKFGSEIVVRPDTIVYLALQYISHFPDTAILRSIFSEIIDENIEWANTEQAIAIFPKVLNAVDKLVSASFKLQKPILMQPVWKTVDTSSVLHEDCLDIFVWTDAALTRLFFDVAEARSRKDISRHQRTVIWLARMICSYLKDGHMVHSEIIDSLTYDTKNDKAFSVGGDVTRRYMESDELTSPRIKKSEIKSIILGDSYKLLSPERRFDMALTITPDLFTDSAV